MVISRAMVITISIRVKRMSHVVSSLHPHWDQRITGTRTEQPDFAEGRPARVIESVAPVLKPDIHP